MKLFIIGYILLLLLSGIDGVINKHRDNDGSLVPRVVDQDNNKIQQKEHEESRLRAEISIPKLSSFALTQDVPSTSASSPATPPSSTASTNFAASTTAASKTSSSNSAYTVVLSCYALVGFISLCYFSLMIYHRAWFSRPPYVDQAARLFSLNYFVILIVTIFKALALENNYLMNFTSKALVGHKFTLWLRTFFLVGQFFCYVLYAFHTTFHAAPMHWVTAAQKTVDKPFSHPLILIPFLILFIPLFGGLISLYCIVFYVPVHMLNDEMKESVAQAYLIGATVIILVASIFFTFVGIFSIHRAFKWYYGGDRTVLPGLTRHTMFTIISCLFVTELLITVGLLASGDFTLAENPIHLAFYFLDILCDLLLLYVCYRRTAWQKHEEAVLAKNKVTFEEKAKERQEEIEEQRRARAKTIRRKETKEEKDAQLKKEGSQRKRSPDPPPQHSVPSTEPWKIPSRPPPLPPKPSHSSRTLPRSSSKSNSRVTKSKSLRQQALSPPSRFSPSPPPPPPLPSVSSLSSSSSLASSPLSPPPIPSPRSRSPVPQSSGGSKPKLPPSPRPKTTTTISNSAARASSLSTSTATSATGSTDASRPPPVPSPAPSSNFDPDFHPFVSRTETKRTPLLDMTANASDREIDMDGELP